MPYLQIRIFRNRLVGNRHRERVGVIGLVFLTVCLERYVVCRKRFVPARSILNANGAFISFRHVTRSALGAFGHHALNRYVTHAQHGASISAIPGEEQLTLACAERHQLGCALGPKQAVAQGAVLGAKGHHAAKLVFRTHALVRACSLEPKRGSICRTGVRLHVVAGQRLHTLLELRRVGILQGHGHVLAWDQQGDLKALAIPHDLRSCHARNGDRAQSLSREVQSNGGRLRHTLVLVLVLGEIPNDKALVCFLVLREHRRLYVGRLSGIYGVGLHQDVYARRRLYYLPFVFNPQLQILLPQDALPLTQLQDLLKSQLSPLVALVILAQHPRMQLCALGNAG